MAKNYAQARFLREARRAAGLSQYGAANRIQMACRGHARNGELEPCMFDASQLSRYENGARRPNPEHIEAISNVYGTEPKDLQRAVWNEPTDPVNIGVSCLNDEGDTPDEVRATKRRAFMRAAGISGSAILSGTALESMDVAIAMQASDMPGGTLAQTHAQVDYLIHAFGHAPADELRVELEEVTTQVVAHLMRRLSLRERTELTADLAKLNGLLAAWSLNFGTVRDARSHLASMRSLAEEVGYGDLVAWSYSVMAKAALLEASPSQALKLAVLGLRHASSPMLQARLACQAEAQAYALLQNHEATVNAIRRAEHLAEQNSTNVDDPTAFAFNPADVRFYAGMGYVQLGTEPERARENAEQGLKLYQERGLSPRSQASSRIDIASSYAQSGEPGEACRIAGEAIAAQAPFGSLFTHIRMLEQALMPYRDHSAVRDLRERLAAWKRGGSQTLTSGA